MFFITPIIVGMILVGSFSFGNVVEEQAIITVEEYNVAQVSRMVEIYYVDFGKYPKDLKELLQLGEVRNINIEKYKYVVTADLQKYSLEPNK